MLVLNSIKHMWLISLMFLIKQHTKSVNKNLDFYMIAYMANNDNNACGNGITQRGHNIDGHPL